MATTTTTSGTELTVDAVIPAPLQQFNQAVAGAGAGIQQFFSIPYVKPALAAAAVGIVVWYSMTHTKTKKRGR